MSENIDPKPTDFKENTVIRVSDPGEQLDIYIHNIMKNMWVVTWGGSCIAAILCGFLGAIGAKIGDYFSMTGESIGGAVGTSVGVALLVLLISKLHKEAYFAILLGVATFAFTLFVDTRIPNQYDWRVFRWILGSMPLVMFTIGLLYPLWVVRDKEPPLEEKRHIFYEIAAILANIILTSRDQFTSFFLTSVIGALIGTLWATGVLVGFGGSELSSWLDGTMNLFYVAGVISLVSGGSGAYLASREMNAIIKASNATAANNPN